MLKYFLALSFLIINSTTEAQVLGCTDPLAVNYSSEATDNDGSCTYNPAAVSPEFSIELSDTIDETSGLIIWNDQLISHNDDGDTKLYTLDTLSGEILGSYNLVELLNIDWEEIAQDSEFIYIGDFGNNTSGNRTDLKIFRIAKESLLNEEIIIDTINFNYSDQIDFSPQATNSTDFDCEAFIVSSDSIFLFSKQWQGNNSVVYSLPKIPGVHEAQLKFTLTTEGMVTGATYLEEARMIALSGYSNALQPFLYLLYDFNGYNFLNGNKRKLNVSLPFHQVEGIATKDGIKFYLSNEKFVQGNFINIPPKLHVIDLNEYLGFYMVGDFTEIPDTVNDLNFSLYPNPASTEIYLETNGELVDSNYVITSSNGSVILSGKLSGNNVKIDVSSFPAGMYYFKISGIINKSFKVVKQ